MCGIAGIFGAARTVAIDAGVVRAMTQAIAHRGPDGDGVDVGPGFGLGHRRLAIVDLATGAQPMATADGQLRVTFNGEIYNYKELRAELERGGARFQTNSDTEVLLHGYRAWGTDLAARLRGMFAFAVVDTVRHELYAARDRVGKKPFYWAQRDGKFAFASELKALHDFGIDRRLRPDAVAQFFALRYVPDPLTIFVGAHKLPPGHWCRVADGAVQQRCFWQYPVVAGDPRPQHEHERAVLELLDESVRIRLMGEVPLAPFLSGGIDSYAIVDSMARTTRRKVTACTIGFTDPAYDERSGARQSAAACGAELMEEVLRVEDLLDLDWYADTFDEPFADSSAVPTYHVSRLARRHVTVALSGDGGDENFCGYRRYLFDWRENKVRRYLPRGMWRGLSWLAPKGDWLPRWARGKRTLQNLACSPAMAYARSVSANLPEEVGLLLRPEHSAAASDALQPVIAAYEAARGGDALQRAVAADYATWLPGDILVKADRASMATALEVRAPFLDHRFLEYAAAIPTAQKLGAGGTKAFLRRALAPRLDPAALRRKKQGFSVPLRQWLQGKVGDALLEELGGPRLREWIDPEVPRALLARHRLGVRDHGELLWAVLVFARFLRRWCP